MRHRGSAPRFRPPWMVSLQVVAMGLGLVAAASRPGPAWATVETWRQEGPTAFAKCHREGVVVSDNGRVRLGHAVSPFGSLSAARVWDLARTKDGALFAATGDSGQIFRREPKADAAWTVSYDANDSQVLSLVVGPDDTVFAGTGPNGQVIDLTRSETSGVSSRPQGPVRLGPGRRRAGQPVCGHRPERSIVETVSRRPMVAAL